ncbi:MAG TPA: hypothetical protein VMG12_27630 [Polyangiaceae bacterium]|nr:hypothetical protein [Polyangiaceae bacterium]
MSSKHSYRPERDRRAERAARWSALLLVACGGSASAPPGPGSPSDEAAPGPDSASSGSGDPMRPSTEPSLSWAVPAGAASPALSLKVGLDAGGGQPHVNATGDFLIAGPQGVGSVEQRQYLPALTRRDAAGTGLWARAYTPDARLVAALEDDGGTVAAGSFTGNLNLAGAELVSFRNAAALFGSASSQDDNYQRGERSWDIALLRLTPQGDVAWARRFGDAGDQAVRALERTDTGEFVVAGDFQAELEMDGLRVTSSGGGVRADSFIARFDADGNALSLWREDPLYIDAILSDGDGSLWIAGRVNDLSENRLWKLGADGQRQLTIDVSATGIASAARLVRGPGGSIYALYNGTEDSPLFARSIPGAGALVRLSPAGEVEWLVPLSTDFAIATIASDAEGNVAVAGAYRSSIDLGAGPLASAGELDVFIASFSAQGSLRYGFRFGGAGQDGISGIAARPGGGWLVPFYLEQPITLLEQSVPTGEHLLWIDER